tara:strand:- start:2680 stop:3171 length:492 start_codon:yes stop_codon:yes gene_type:complete
MADKHEEKQPSKREDPVRADHLEPYRWKKGQSGNLKGRPKGAVGLSKRIEERLLEAISADDPRQLADLLAGAIVKTMLQDPVKAERLISKFMDRDEGPVEKDSVVQIGIDARGVVPQAPPLIEAGSDGSPTFVDHLKRLLAIADERGLSIDALDMGSVDNNNG